METIKLYHPSGSGCSWGGEVFEPGADGGVEVPIEAAAELADHGFSGVAPDASPDLSAVDALGQIHDEDEGEGENVLSKLAKQNRKTIAAYAKQVYGVILDARKNKDTLLLAIAKLAGELADMAPEEAPEPQAPEAPQEAPQAPAPPDPLPEAPEPPEAPVPSTPEGLPASPEV